MAAVVERDDAALVACQGRDPGGLHPVRLLVGGKAMDQDDRLALASVEIRDLDVIVLECRHSRGLSSSGDRCQVIRGSRGRTQTGAHFCWPRSTVLECNRGLS